ncbi:MAG: FG-GAP repeat protein [Sandaracinaceae bacterium]|nr:FG-GAP repeat protein [Sandaracinaceae bacterium]
MYVFTRVGATWTQQAYLKASNVQGSDRFGFTVAVSGDTIAVGAPGEDSAAPGVNGDEADNSLESTGAVYVFTRSGASWSQQAYLKASNPDSTDSFGVALGLSGDTLAVGANWEDSTATGAQQRKNRRAGGGGGGGGGAPPPPPGGGGGPPGGAGPPRGGGGGGAGARRGTPPPARSEPGKRTRPRQE